ncbi:hypothetical protein [Natrinema sp. DC36]|uniref:hypothetical protein n=1 Tax=Natrinema sp. DC36 TaxID=2878680 RepID=UPI001CF09E63|nr:hypothetical protein [Natrinema sp. DC36]
MIREIGEDAHGRWEGDSNPLCDDCQQPLPKVDAVELDGEPAHRSCANDVEASRRARAARGGLR